MCSICVYARRNLATWITCPTGFAGAFRRTGRICTPA